MQPMSEATTRPAPETDTRLGAAFWAAWTAGLAATLGAFLAALWLAAPWMDSPQGALAGGAILIAFTLAIIGLASLPGRMKRRRGIGERLREPYRRYMRRFLPAMLAYVILLIAAISYAQRAEPTGLIAWLVAIAPAIPVLFLIRAIFLLPVEEDDEYQRARIYSSYAWATGATLMTCTTLGFLDMFGVLPHLEMWIAVPLWAVFMGLARALPMGSVR